MLVRNLLISVFFVFSINTVALAEVASGSGVAQTTNSAVTPESKPELTQAQKLKRMRHASPLPNLMRIALSNIEAIKLDQAQVRNLEFWRGRQSLTARRLVREIMALEADVRASSLSGKSTGYLINQMSTLLGKRMQLASQKILCRDNMMHVLTPQQWSKVVELYRQSV